MDELVGFIGLGNMGRPLAANLVAEGHPLLVYDKVDPEARAPEGAAVARSIDEVFASCAVTVLSLPDGGVVLDVVRAALATTGPALRFVVDTSTVGPGAAVEAARLLAERGIAYVDAPLSGGVRGALRRTVAFMVATDDETYGAVRPVICGMSDVHVRVGDTPGQGQAVKLANNFLAATALVATSEAVAFGEAYGVEGATMVGALNKASGRNSATEDKFPNQILPGTYAGGFSNVLMDKDLGLYLQATDQLASPDQLGRRVRSRWGEFVGQEPGADSTRIYPFVAGSGREQAAT